MVASVSSVNGHMRANGRSNGHSNGEGRLPAPARRADSEGRVEQPGGAEVMIDLDDGVQVRTYLEGYRAQMASDRSTWDPHWMDLCDVFNPRAPSWDYTDTNYGDRRDFAIINETGIECRHTLAAGIASGMTPQSATWFEIGAASEILDQKANVRNFCEEVAKRVRKKMLKSNFYQTLLNLYDEEGYIGTSAFTIMPDDATTFRCYEYQIGRYYLTTDNTRRVSLVLRTLYLTADQLVQEFGFANCSNAVQVLYQAPAGGNRETRYPVAHVIMRGDFWSVKPRAGEPDWPWREIYYEIGAYSQGEKLGILKEGGFHEQPFCVGRWKVTGENVYGESPGMDCLGSLLSLQNWEERTAQAAEKQINPPTVAGTSVDPRKVSTLPGDVIFINDKDATKAFTPAYNVDFKIADATNMIQRIEGRIRRLMYSSVFQAVTNAERDKTAEEVHALRQEQLAILGPVVERNVEEVFQPAIQRIVGIMERAGELPPFPAEMKKADGSLHPFKLEFTSILAKAQRMAGITNLTQFLTFIGSQAAVFPALLDAIKPEAVVQEYVERADISATILRSPEEIAQMQAQRNQQQALAQQADAAQKLAGAAQAAGQAQPSPDNLLGRLPAFAGQTGGGGGPGPPPQTG